MGTLNSQSLPSSLRRRNSMTSDLLIPTNHLQSSSSFPPTSTNKSCSSSPFPSDDLELISLKSLAYTSLKDLLPSLSAVQSPTGVPSQSVYEIPIRNHLVKQAAWAYLQPMSTSPGSSNRYSFRRMWTRFSTDYVRNPVNACLGFISQHVLPTISRVFDMFLGAIRVRINTTR